MVPCTLLFLRLETKRPYGCWYKLSHSKCIAQDVIIFDFYPIKKSKHRIQPTFSKNKTTTPFFPLLQLNIIQKDIPTQHQYKLNSKIAHKAMKRYSRPDSQSNEESAAKGVSFPERQILTPKTPINPIILQHEVESDNSVKQDGKFSMEDLCKAFIERIGPKVDCQFQAKELVEATGVKQRRIYDLMNILEGCGFMKRISKGTYMWYGFEEGSTKKGQKEGRKKEATSLSFLAARVKYLLFNAPTYIDFKDICQQILEENSNNNFNPDSIKRRVYECCKILKVVGLIDKKQHTFKWITNQDRERTQEKTENMKKENLTQNQVETLKKQKDQQLYRQHLVSELIKEVRDEQQLRDLLQTISNEFNKKKLIQNHPYPRRLFGDS